MVNLYMEKKVYPRRIHRLVLEAFVCDCPDGHRANHKDGIKTNNKLENLEWVTPSEDAQHAFRIGLRTHKGIRHPQAKLRNEDILKMRELHNQGTSQRILAKMFDVCRSHVNRIIHHKRWSHI